MDRAVRYLKDGGVVAIPTDTLYGLAADVFNHGAIDRVFAVKGRSETSALPVLVNGWEQVHMVATDVPPQAKRLASQFWPGALTLVVLQADGLPDRLLMKVLDEQPVRDNPDLDIVAGQDAQRNSGAVDRPEFAEQIPLGDREAVERFIPAGRGFDSPLRQPVADVAGKTVQLHTEPLGGYGTQPSVEIGTHTIEVDAQDETRLSNQSSWTSR